MNRALEGVITDELSALGFELVEIRWGGTKRRPLIDVRIDRLDGEKVSIDDCAVISRALQPKIDATGLVGEEYVLEVSSPGVERPLRGARDWRRFVGRRASVLADALGGRQRVEIVGLEGDEGAETAVLRNEKGSEVRVPLADVREARLVFEWKG
jgi:ribosome maturation factor RimP